MLTRGPQTLGWVSRLKCVLMRRDYEYRLQGPLVVSPLTRDEVPPNLGNAQDSNPSPGRKTIRGFVHTRGSTGDNALRGIMQTCLTLLGVFSPLNCQKSETTAPYCTTGWTSLCSAALLCHSSQVPAYRADADTDADADSVQLM